MEFSAKETLELVPLEFSAKETMEGSCEQMKQHLVALDDRIKGEWGLGEWGQVYSAISHWNSMSTVRAWGN